MSLFQNYSADEFYRISTPSQKPMGSATDAVQEIDMGTPKPASPGFLDYASDAVLGIPRGILGGVSDIASLAAMPFDYDVPDYFGLMSQSTTAAGSITEGVSNFLTGFIPGLGVAGKLGKVGKIAKATAYLDEAATIARMAGRTKKAAAITGLQSMAKGAVAGAVADFAAFDGHEARLSNLLRDYAGLRDPITEFLAADPNDSEVGGRLKNAIEGLGIGGLTEGVFNAVRLYRAGYIGRSVGSDPVEAMAREQLKIRNEQRSLIKQYVPELNDQQADVANWLIDQFGVDRSKLSIVGGEEAQKVYQQFGGMALEQRPQWNTPEFRQWFTGSKVTDKAGDPMVMYHGTNAKFDAFENRMDVGDGIYFSSDKKYAAEYAGARATLGGKKRIVSSYLDIKNPLVIDGENRTLWEKYTQRGFNTKELSDQGYDGVLVKYADGETEAMVFRPEQIKSATENVGTFNKGVPSIFEQTGEAAQVKGFAAFAEDGRRVIGFLNSPNFSTAVEEISHVGRRQLFDKAVPQSLRMGITDVDIDNVAKWSGATQRDGQWVWDVASEEKFAKGFQKYLRDGEAPAGMEGLFKNITDWMISLYRDITGSELDLVVSKEVKDSFDKIMKNGPGFDKAGAPGRALGGPQILRQAAPAPGTPGAAGAAPAAARGVTKVPPGNVGLGKPGGTPDMPLNLERISSSEDAARTMRTIVEQERASMADKPLNLEDVAAEAKPVAETLSRYIPEMDPLTVQRVLSTGKNSAWQLRDASIELQGMRKYESSAAQRLFELSSKGTGASADDMYEFLLGETALRTVAHQIKQRSREIARALVSMRIVPVPDRTFSFLPSIPKAGEALPSPAAMAPSPAAMSPSPAAAAPSPAAVAPSPATITPGMSPEARASVVRQVIEQAGGEEAVRAKMVRFMAAHRTGGAEAVMKLADGYRGPMAALTEYWMNSILSGPVTHAVNIGSNLITALYLPFERALGASVRSDWKTAGNSLRQYISLASEFSEAVKLAGMAFKLDENILSKVGTSERDVMGRAISGTGLGLKEGTVGSLAADWIGKALNIPTRLLAAEDEFFKQLQYRSSYKTDLYIEGMSRFNGDTRAAAQWAEETFNRTIKDGQAYSEGVVLRRANIEAERAISEGTITASAKGDFVARYMADEKNWDPTLGALSQRAMERAQYSTFSNALDASSDRYATRLGAGVQNLVNKNPYLRFLFPFIRTPTNLLNFTIERSAFGIPRNTTMAFREYGSLLNHADAAVRADAAGRLAFSAAITATVGIAVASGAVTGGGPKNKAEREAKIQAGWQPYSIRVGDTYYSYRREDPFSSIIGIIADIGEGFQYASERNVKGLDAALNTAVLALARNFTNKTYLTGITNLTNALSNPEQFGQNLVNQYVSSLVPFSSGLSQSVYTVSGDPVMRDVRTMVDAMKAKVPYLAEDVAPRRNVLGEVIEAPSRGARGLSMINPVTYTEVTDDKILREFDLLGHGFSPPKETRGAIDLTSFKTSSGQMAYDRWLELHGKVQIGGKTLRQSLLKLIGSRDYQKLSPVSTDDYDSPRIREVRTMISKYREAAYKQLLKESPELNQASRIDFANKQALRMGRSAQELLDLGNR